MDSMLYRKIQYNADINFLVSRYIREYDIHKANISILYSKGVLSQENYNRLYNADRMTRQIEIGNMERENREVYNILKNGILEVKEWLFKANNIQDNEVFSIKNDAIFIIDKILINTQFNNIVRFDCKNLYTSVYKLYGKELYYYFDGINNVEILDIKGIRPERLILHQNHFYEFLKVLFCSAQTEDISDTIDLLTKFYNSYLNLELDINFYRRFDSDSLYVLKKAIRSNVAFKADFLEEKDKGYIDISYNNNILRELSRFYSQLLFARKFGR